MSGPRPLRTIFRYWVPMFGTWMMMAVEAPFVAAVMARMDDPKPNLAAFGVAYAVATLVESPVIMILSASTALVRGAASFDRLRRFTWMLNAGLTAVMLALVLTPAWSLIGARLIGLPERVVELSGVGLTLMTLWPAAIGYRRFFQGLLVQAGRTRQVAYGTVARLLAMAGAATGLYLWSDWPGAWVGTAAIGLGVVVEAVACRLMALAAVREIRARSTEASPPTYAEIRAFYWPLALTSVIGLAVHPAVTAFVGHARFPLESLAVLPVVNSLTFIFRSVGLSYQEVAIALLSRDEPGCDGPGRDDVLRFARRLGLGATLAMALIAFTPLARIWFHDVSGLSDELTRFAITPARILALLPALSVLLSMQRAILVHGRLTAPITRATVVEVAGIVATMVALTAGLDAVGAVAAAASFLVGRLAGNATLVGPCRRVLAR
jgi:hypothetical protein